MTLDDIKRSIGHDKQCVARVQRELGALQVEDRNCDCTRRGKIALLERLQEPTERMRRAVVGRGFIKLGEDEVTGETTATVDVAEIFKAMLKAAGETK